MSALARAGAILFDLLIVSAWIAKAQSSTNGSVSTAFPTRFGVVDAVPTSDSGIAPEFAEPSIAVGSGGMYGSFAVHTFTIGFGGGDAILTSSGNVLSWADNSPSFKTQDSTLDWSPGGTVYWSFLDSDQFLQIYSSPNPATMPFSAITAGTIQYGCDQPQVKVANVDGVDHIYIGYAGPTTSVNSDGETMISGYQEAVHFSLDGGASWTSFFPDMSEMPSGFARPRIATSADGKIVYVLGPVNTNSAKLRRLRQRR